MARLLVRGLAASSSASAQRLKAMAAERAATMATRIHPTLIHKAGRPPGNPLAASSTAVRANGSAKIECSHLIISSVVRVLDNIPGIGGSIHQCNGAVLEFDFSTSGCRFLRDALCEEIRSEEHTSEL